MAKADILAVCSRATGPEGARWIEKEHQKLAKNAIGASGTTGR
jgi:hypothetical protein